MKWLPTILAVVIVAAGWFFLSNPAVSETGSSSPGQWTFTPEQDGPPVDPRRISYALGYRVGKGISQQGMDELDIEILKVGLAHGVNPDATPWFTEPEMGKDLQGYIAYARSAAMKKQAEATKLNVEKGAAFLEEFRSKPGVRELDNGILYREISPGTGKIPAAADTVVANYEGRLIDGQVFDSSYERGSPATFALNRVIKGWQEALTHMPEGATWEVAIPADQAYGVRGSPPKIGPNSTLIFKINLVEVKPAKVDTPDLGSDSDAENNENRSWFN